MLRNVSEVVTGIQRVKRRQVGSGKVGSDSFDTIHLDQ
jgi:hypothetical protein